MATTSSYIRQQSFALAIIDLGLVMISSLLRLVYIFKPIPDLLNFDLDLLPLKLLQLPIEYFFKIEIVENFLFLTTLFAIFVEILLYLLLVNGTKEMPDSDGRRSLKICLWLVTRLTSFIFSLLFILIEGRGKSLFGGLYMIYRAVEIVIVTLLFRHILDKTELIHPFPYEMIHL